MFKMRWYISPWILAAALVSVLPSTSAGGDRYKVISYMSADVSRTGRTGSSIVERTWGLQSFVQFPIDSLSLSAIDILILFCNHSENVTAAPPYLSILGGQPDSLLYFHGADGNFLHSTDTIIQRMHRRGKQVLLSLTAQDGNAINSIAADSAMSEAYAAAVAKLARRHGFDGIDLNIEHYVDTTDLARLFRIQRRQLNREYPVTRALFTVSPPPTYESMYPLSADSCITYYMPQYYGMKTAWNGCTGQGVVWPGNAYSRGPWPACFNGENLLEDGPRTWIRRGFPSRKIVPGIFAQGYTFPGADSIGHPVGPSYLAETSVWYTREFQMNLGLRDEYSDYLKQRILRGTQSASTPQVGYAGPGGSAGAKTIITLPNDSTAKYTAFLVDSLNLGGIMTWVLDREFDKTRPVDNGRIFVTERAQYWLGLFGDGVLPPPVGTLSATPPQIPTAGGRVRITWTSRHADQVLITPGIGVVGESGYRDLDITEPTTFTMFLSGPSGERTYTILVDVAPELPPVWVVYDDSLHAPFGDHSWATSNDFENHEQVVGGQSAIRVEFDEWGGLSLALLAGGEETLFPRQSYDSLLFDARVEGPTALAVGFQSAISRELSLTGGRWERIAVPLPSFDFSRFWIQNRGGGGVVGYFDNVRLIATAAKGPTDVDPVIPADFALSRNYPNPFNPETRIDLTLPEAMLLSLKVYDMLGRQVATLTDGFLTAGRHTFRWNASGLSSGQYLCRLVSPGHTDTILMTYLK